MLQDLFEADVIVECLEWRTKLTCTEPGSAPGRSCAGPWAAGTGSGRDTVPRQLHRDPAAQGEVTVNTAACASPLKVLRRSS